jgi:hypothetical protein
MRVATVMCYAHVVVKLAVTPTTSEKRSEILLTIETDLLVKTHIESTVELIFGSPQLGPSESPTVAMVKGIGEITPVSLSLTGVLSQEVFQTFGPLLLENLSLEVSPCLDVSILLLILILILAVWVGDGPDHDGPPVRDAE